MVTKLKNLKSLSDQGGNLIPLYARNEMEQPVPKFELADGELPPSTAYSLIRDELMLDGNAAQPGDFRHDLDGAGGREAHGRGLRQEHDRQG